MNPKHTSEENWEIIQDFIAESRDMLDSLDPCLMTMEKTFEHSGPPDLDLIHEIFRTFHSIKGAASFLDFDAIARLTHQGEYLLDHIRKGKTSLNINHLELLFRSGDLLRKLIEQVSVSSNDYGLDEEIDRLIARYKEAMPQKTGHESQEGDLFPEEGERLHPIRIAPEPDSIGTEARQAISQEILRLLDTAGTRLDSYGKTGDIGQMKALNLDLQCVQGHLEVLGHRPMARLCQNLTRLLEQLGEKKGPPDKNSIGIYRRLLDGLQRTIASIRDGHSTRDFVEPLSNLLGELYEKQLDGRSQAFLGSIMVRMGAISEDQLQIALSKQERPLGEILLDMDLISNEQLELGLKLQKKEQVLEKARQEGTVYNIRVDLNKLDQLGNMVGELVIAENMVTHHPLVMQQGFEDYRKSATALNRISREIQDLVMSLRMVPIQATFIKMKRIARDVAHKLDKKIEVKLVGDTTEIDRKVVENMSSPLLHIIRNAVDHGLEVPAERLRAGKPEMGIVNLEASQQGGEIQIIIQDDGRGMDPEMIRNKAVERGIISSEKVFASNRDIFELIFEPGFSTASTVTDISGRGVGMDVVRKNVERLQGRVTIDSSPGLGSKVTLTIPLTLSIIEGMMVRLGNAVLTIPLLNIRESFSPRGYRITRTPDGVESIRIRDQLLSIMRLGEVLGLPFDYGIDNGILVEVEWGTQRRCLLVDEVLGQRQTVIKRVSNFLGNLKGVSGFSILSNGDITLILDIPRLLST